MSELALAPHGDEDSQRQMIEADELTDISFKSDVVTRLVDIAHSLAYDECSSKLDACRQLLDVVEFVQDHITPIRMLREG